MNVSTLSPEKSKDKEMSEGMTGDLADKDEKSVEKKDQPTDIVYIEDLDSDDVPISQRLDPGVGVSPRGQYFWYLYRIIY